MCNRLIWVKDSKTGKFREATKKEKKEIHAVIQEHAEAEDSRRFCGEFKEHRTNLSL